MRRTFVRAALLAVAGGVLICQPSCSLLRFQRSGNYAASPHFATPPQAWSAARTLRVVTFNIKDMYWLSERRAERMAGIAKALVAAAPDVVCLQEGFIAGDVGVVAEALHGIGVEHAVDFPSGMVGSGMWVLSRFPIVESYFVRYSQNGAMLDFRGGDWWAGKGVGLARLEVAPGELLDVYNTHMICNLGGAELRAHRHVQVREYCGFATAATPKNVPALLLGDFNCGYGGADSDHLHYVMRWEPMLERRYGYDHVFARSEGGVYRFTPLAEVAIDGTVTINGDPPTKDSLSDHTGLLAEIRIEPPPPK